MCWFSSGCARSSSFNSLFKQQLQPGFMEKFACYIVAGYTSSVNQFVEAGKKAIEVVLLSSLLPHHVRRNIYRTDPEQWHFLRFWIKDGKYNVNRRKNSRSHVSSPGWLFLKVSQTDGKLLASPSLLPPPSGNVPN